MHPSARSSLAPSPALGSPSLNSPRAQQVSSAADLTASVRRTTGEQPPPLVGCSVTLVADSIYVFGGRLVPTRTMVSTLYKLDLRSLAWSQVWPPSSSSAGEADEDGPQARYFHSACAWGDKLVIFGGEGYEDAPLSPPSSAGRNSLTASTAINGSTGTSETAPQLRTLADVCIWDTTEGRWLEAETKVAETVERPAPRYAHLGVATSAVVEEEVEGRREKRERSVMLVMGGQDVRNTYLHSTNVLDLSTLTWIHSGTWDRHIGTYRAVCTAPAYRVVPPAPVAVENPRKYGLEEGEGVMQLGRSERPMEGKEEPLLLFSNFNFTQVRRDLDLLSSPLASSPAPLTPLSLSSSMSGPSLPPGLRFPTGTIIGHHLLVFGTFLSHAVNNFSIWALDLGPAGASGVRERIERGERLEWARIDPGSVLARGSWNRAVGWGNSVVVLGDRERDIAADYDHRQTNFTHLAFIDLESFGIYHPPPSPLPLPSALLGLRNLAQPFLSDFEILCSDGKRLGCSRRLLSERWGWFKAKVGEFERRAEGVRRGRAAQDADGEEGAEEGEEGEGDGGEGKKPALTPRALTLPEPSPVVLAFLQYLSTLSLLTPLQLHPPVLAALLTFSRAYAAPAPWHGDGGEGEHLRALAVHALHGVLEREQGAAPMVYEAATLGGCTALQIRALRTMLSNPQMRARGGQTPNPNASQPSSQTGQSRLAVGA
ncbi:hypothetical protein JCM8097_000636 [Rhodosporidiobolus ruineniae]